MSHTLPQGTFGGKGETIRRQKIFSIGKDGHGVVPLGRRQPTLIAAFVHRRPIIPPWTLRLMIRRECRSVGLFLADDERRFCRWCSKRLTGFTASMWELPWVPRPRRRRPERSVR